jgi:hypothetical protein
MAIGLSPVMVLFAAGLATILAFALTPASMAQPAPEDEAE